MDKKNSLNIKLSASFEGIDAVCADVKPFLIKNGFEKFVFDIQLGIREALTNAVKYGSKMDSSKEIRLVIEFNEKQILIRVTDQGTGFIRLGSKPILALETDTHGRGMEIFKQYFDQYSFNSIGNEIELIKKL